MEFLCLLFYIYSYGFLLLYDVFNNIRINYDFIYRYKINNIVICLHKN